MATQHYYSFDEIHQMGGGAFTLHDLELQKIIAQLLTYVPADVVDYLIEHCVVISSWNNCYGLYFENELIQGKGIILLSEYLLDGDENEREKTILHEFAHCWLKHVSPILAEGMTGEEILKQEEEADGLVYKWIKKKELGRDKAHL